MEFLNTALSSFADILHSVPNISVGVAVVSIILGYILSVTAYAIIRDFGVPPGPTGVPILGYWPFIDSENIHLQQIDLKKKYGDIFSFRVTGKLYINLASVKLLREAHITKADCFRERTSEFTIGEQIFDQGVIFSRGEKWQAVRRYFLTQFRERGMTLYRENTADTVEETVSNLVDELKRYSGKPVNILKLLTKRSNRIIRDTLFGLNTPIKEEDVENIQEEYRIVGSLIHSSNLLLHGTIAKYFIFPFLPEYKKAMAVTDKVKNRFRKMVDDHRRTFDGDNVRDIIDSYILEKNTRKSKGDSTYEYFTDETLVSNLLQFVGDGVVNVATFVTFMLMALLDHPEEQEKIYREIIEICGEDRNPTLGDKSKMTYTNAFLLEAQRMANFVPLFPSLECTKDTTLGGYRIPKGSVTVMNVYAIHNDPTVYEDPAKFNASRFLAKEGKPKEESPVTFGVGKRVCIGESFVLMQVFVFLTAIVQNFKITYSVPKTHFEVLTSRSLDVYLTPRK